MSEIDRRSKWTKYMFMRESQKIRRHVPKSEKFTERALWDFIANYGDVILKPINGSRGFGVYRVSAIGNGIYCIHNEKTRNTVRGEESTYNYLMKKIGSRKYMVQRRITLATVNDRPFDMRVIVQRRRLSDSWKVTGKVAKVAGEGYIVTNITRSKGTVLPVETAIEKSSLIKHSHITLLSNIDKIALQSARILSKNKLYSSKRIFGFDMGLDQESRVWVIEANLNPMLSHFLKLKDRTMYHRIMKYKKG